MAQLIGRLSPCYQQLTPSWWNFSGCGRFTDGTRVWLVRSEIITVCTIAETGIVFKAMARSVDNDPTPESFLPLHRDTFQILVSLADGDRHGYAIMQDIADRTGDARAITPSTLYSSIRRLLESGLIKELHDPPDRENDDARRRYYRLTVLGRRVAELEARRLQRLLLDARNGGLLPKRS
jgi:DNA-binding PadR family transcriptional regulator